ncbi:antibiotic biosynthesis monooxygenase [Rhizorhabdus dicambivorans]|uniref:Antibiotic biosynthesis monooxygenase n=2 Tax=Rhizorhabdus dicambivorans TaxID=1850238 RepID=A0A2A4FQP6_9SPHN|nr:antibiotic biosynthesis monooxygenase [Rhizorhabdus dicambivorans]PCE39721.1 antibiotic biosynthesis monooxygenase [Rhizorhabdus dicambivorans]
MAIKIVAILTAKPGKADALRSLLDGVLAASRAEPGNLRWDIWQDEADLNRLLLDELYEDDAAVAAHRASPHFLHYLSKIHELADRTALVLSPIAAS